MPTAAINNNNSSRQHSLLHDIRRSERSRVRWSHSLGDFTTAHVSREFYNLQGAV
jgi:hypothetical protein